MSIKEKFFYNFGSSVLPMLLSIMIIPELINIIGIERFGILTIAWMIIGYFGLLDIGLGRALTQKVATKIGNSDVQNLRLLIFIIIIVLFFIGVFSGTLIYIFIEKIVLDIFNISNVYHSEVISGLVWVSISIPIVLVSTALFGVLEGQHNFKVISYIRTPLGIMMLIFPLIVVQYTSSLEWILASLFLSRIIVLLILIGTTLYYTKAKVISSPSHTQIRKMHLVSHKLSQTLLALTLETVHYKPMWE
jgi:O-antigen/teichoic acid export membrane protein